VLAVFKEADQTTLKSSKQGLKIMKKSIIVLFIGILQSVSIALNADSCVCSYIPFCVGNERVTNSATDVFLEWSNIAQPTFSGSALCASGKALPFDQKITCERTVLETFSSENTYSGSFSLKAVGLEFTGRNNYQVAQKTRVSVDLTSYCQCCQVGNYVNCTKQTYSGLCDASGCNKLMAPLPGGGIMAPSPCTKTLSGIVVNRTDQYPSVEIDLNGNSIPDCRESNAMKACKTTCDPAGGSGAGGI
jgi:hypothetical protein